MREIALMRRLDSRERIDFVDVSEEDAAVSCPISRQALLERFHARDRDGKLQSGAAAFAVMWRVIPLLKPLGYLARLPFALTVLEWSYCQFLKVRPRLQRVFAEQ
ncbi:MAG: DCC1-like thiol-disulfide oxidoreductase family protein [Pseudomonadota bacterium]